MREALAQLCARPIAHRGLHACGDKGPVENSLSAAEAAIKAGYGIECDIQLSADGEAMVFHDASLDRLTDASGRTIKQSAAVLSDLRLRGGPDRIPTLAAFLAAIDRRAPLVVEIKVQSPGDMRLAERALSLARGYDGPIVLESFDPAVAAFCRAQEAPCPIGLVGPPEDGAAAGDADLDICDFVSWNIQHLPEIAAHRPHLPRTTWTVRTQAQVQAAKAHGAQIVFEGFTPVAVR